MRNKCLILLAVLFALYSHSIRASDENLILLNSEIRKKRLNPDESAILEKFFQVLLEECEAGYVLLGEKPLCIYGYRKEAVNDIFFPDHKQSLALYEGGKIWKEHFLPNQNEKILIHFTEEEDPSIPGIQHILVINVPLFHKVVNEHLPLYQHVLGPLFNSEKLLSALVKENEPVHACLKNDSVLVGILLGYGIQNALFGSREEKIQCLSDFPPFCSPKEWKKTHLHEFLPLQPSLGYQSLQKEIKDIEQKMEVSSTKLIQENPTFIFGQLRGLKQNHQLIENLEKIQVRIQKFIGSSKLAQRTMALMGKEELELQGCMSQGGLSIHLDAGLDRSYLVAQRLWEEILPYTKSERAIFCDNLKKGGSVNPARVWKKYNQESLMEAKNNLLEADRFFSNLDLEQNLNCQIPQRLYWRTVCQGNPAVSIASPMVKLTYSIMSPVGHCLAVQNHILINLENTIPGFQQGVQKMHVGETREIWIHPSLAYGLDTSLNKCIYLKAIVTLEDVLESKPFVPSNEMIDLSFLYDLNIEKNDLASLVSNCLAVFEILKKDPEINLTRVIQYLEQFNEEDKSQLLSEEKREMLNRVFWNIYFSSN